MSRPVVPSDSLSAQRARSSMPVFGITSSLGRPPKVDWSKVSSALSAHSHKALHNLGRDSGVRAISVAAERGYASITWEMMQKKMPMLQDEFRQVFRDYDLPDEVKDGFVNNIVHLVVHDWTRDMVWRQIRDYFPNGMAAKQFVNWLFNSVVWQAKTENLTARDYFKAKSRKVAPVLPVELPEAARDTTTGKDSDSAEVFRFLDLPAELKVSIYRYALTPTGIVRRHKERGAPSKNHQSYGIGLLRTCREINKEIGDLLYAENTFYVNADNIATSVVPVIMQRDLPWPLLQHIVLTLDLTENYATAQDLAFSDWRPLQRMTGLKSVRIMVIENYDTRNNDIDALFTEVLERLPASCSIELGPKTDMDKEHVNEWVIFAERIQSRQHDRRDRLYVSKPKSLESAAEKAKVSRGCKSGSDIDYRWHTEATSPNLRRRGLIMKNWFDHEEQF